MLRSSSYFFLCKQACGCFYCEADITSLPKIKYTEPPLQSPANVCPAPNCPCLTLPLSSSWHGCTFPPPRFLLLAIDGGTVSLEGPSLYPFSQSSSEVHSASIAPGYKTPSPPFSPARQLKLIWPAATVVANSCKSSWLWTLPEGGLWAALMMSLPWTL